MPIAIVALPMGFHFPPSDPVYAVTRVPARTNLTERGAAAPLPGTYVLLPAG